MYDADQIRNATSHDAATDMVLSNLMESDIWLARGLVAIYNRQTADEQVTLRTKHNNGRGFNGLDAGILSSFAKQVRTWLNTPPKQRRFASPLSPKQTAIARRKMRKYASQLARVARPQAQPQPANQQVAVGMTMLTSGYRPYGS